MPPQAGHERPGSHEPGADAAFRFGSPGSPRFNCDAALFIGVGQRRGMLRPGPRHACGPPAHAARCGVPHECPPPADTSAAAAGTPAQHLGALQSAASRSSSCPRRAEARRLRGCSVPGPAAAPPACRAPSTGASRGRCLLLAPLICRQATAGCSASHAVAGSPMCREERRGGADVSVPSPPLPCPRREELDPIAPALLFRLQYVYQKININ